MSGHEVTAPDSYEAWLPSGLLEGVGRATEAFFGLFFFFSFSTVEGGGGAEEDTISASEGGGEAIGEAMGDGSKCLDEGLDPN